MDMNVATAQLTALKTAIEKAKTERTRAEANAEAAEKRIKEIEEAIRAEGIEPADLPEHIAKLNAEIEAGLAAAMKMIPEQFMR